MKTKGLLLLLLSTLLFCSCKKEHYDTSQIQGMQIEGGCQMPLLKASYSIGDLMKSFQIDTIITFDEDGGLRFEYNYGQDDVLKGSDFMKFKGFTLDEHFSIDNPYPFTIPEPIDTLIKFNDTVILESDYVTLDRGKMRSGILSFGIETNVAHINSILIRSSEIKDENGDPFEVFITDVSSPKDIDLAGLHFGFESGETHALVFSYEIRVSIDNTTVSEFDFGIHLAATDIDIQEMIGSMKEFELRFNLDTTFALFNENVSGSLELNGIDVTLLERNSFGLAADLKVDTAWILSAGSGHYSFFDPMPIEAELQSSPSNYIEALHHKLNANVNSNSLGMYLSADLVFNPEEEQIILTDTSSIDIALDVDIPFSFKIDDVKYIDTVEMDLSEVESPEMIEELTLEMVFNSTLPLNLDGKFYLYDSKQGVVLDELLSTTGELISASFDGKPVTTNVSITVTEDKLQEAFQADGLIMMYEVDTDAHDVTLNIDQKLDMFLKAKMKYNGNVEF